MSEMIRQLLGQRSPAKAEWVPSTLPNKPPMAEPMIEGVPPIPQDATGDPVIPFGRRLFDDPQSLPGGMAPEPRSPFRRMPATPDTRVDGRGMRDNRT